MVPTSFPDENVLLSTPPTMTSDQCGVISACVTQQDDGLPVIITCWKFTQEDLERIRETGRLWLVIAGHEMPPTCPTTEDPFA